jgi:hypothetical protein
VSTPSASPLPFRAREIQEANSCLFTRAAQKFRIPSRFDRYKGTITVAASKTSATRFLELRIRLHHAPAAGFCVVAGHAFPRGVVFQLSPIHEVPVPPHSIFRAQLTPSFGVLSINAAYFSTTHVLARGDVPRRSHPSNRRLLATDKHDPVYYAGPHVERLRGIGSVPSRIAGGTISYGRSWTLAAKGKPRLGLADYADN